MTSPALSLNSLQFSENQAIIQCHLRNGNVVSFWLMKQKCKIKCRDFDTISIPLTIASPGIFTRYISESFYSELTKEIETTRGQLFRDAVYLHTVGYELEKRFLAARFNARSIDSASTILMQSPFRRWITALSSYLEKNTISVYELYYFTRSILISKFKSVEDINSFILNHFHTIFGRSLSKILPLPQKAGIPSISMGNVHFLRK